MPLFCHCFIHLILSLFSLISCSIIEKEESNEVTIIGTIGGYLHAIKRDSLEVKWSINIGGPLLTANTKTTLKRDYQMIPMIDGTLLYSGIKGLLSLYL